MIRHVVPPALVGRRLDAALAELEPALSRAQVGRLVRDGDVTVGGHAKKPSYRLRAGDRIEGRVPPPVDSGLVAEEIPLRVVHEDDDLIVIDKPPGLVVHPAAGHASGTLVNALLFHCRGGLSGVGGVTRPGIVHRLDKGTSGILVAAKNDAAHRSLAAQFKAHTIDREYLALVRGSPRDCKGTIDAPIGRHPTDRKRFSTRTRSGREAVTHWRVARRLGEFTLMRVTLETGRTHQIRVHLASIGLPVAGDPVYGGGRAASRLLGLERQALHAAVLAFDHPSTGRHVRFSSELPPDLVRVIESLE